MCDTEYDFVPEFRSTNIPKQKDPATPPLNADSEMGPAISGIASFPPLGQVTQLPSSKVVFLVSLEVDEASVDDPWEVSIWYSNAGDGWCEGPLSRMPTGSSLVSLQEPVPSKTTLCFHASVPVSSPLKFTVKFRNRPSKPWRWVYDELAVRDGLVVTNPEHLREQGTTNLSDVIVDLNQDLRVKSVSSQTPGTSLWTIEADIEPALDEKSAYAGVKLGTPWGEYLR